MGIDGFGRASKFSRDVSERFLGSIAVSKTFRELSERFQDVPSTPRGFHMEFKEVSLGLKGFRKFQGAFKDAAASGFREFMEGYH